MAVVDRARSPKWVTSFGADLHTYTGPYLDVEDKFNDCFDAFLEFQDHFRRCQQLPGLVMHFTP